MELKDIERTEKTEKTEKKHHNMKKKSMEKENHTAGNNLWKNDKLFWGICIALGVLLMCYLVWAAGRKEFWYDEVATIGFIRSGLTPWDVLHYYQTIEVTNLPLYALIAYVFYHLFPPENIYLLLPGILMVYGGTALLIRMVDRMIGRKAAYAVLAMSFCSTTMINRMALEFRAYALLFFSTVLVIYCLSVIKDKISIKGLILTTLCMTISAYSHYFAVIYLLALGIGVFIGVIIKKRSWKMMLPFVFSAALFLLWFILAMKKTNVDTGSFWIETPKFSSLPETIGYLLGGNYLLCVFYGVGFILLLYDVVKTKDFWSLRSMVLFSVPIVLMAVFIFSRWINPGGGLYENRYFIVLLPGIYFTTAFGMERILSFGRLHKAAKIVIIGIFALACAMGMRRTIMDSRLQYARYSYAAEYMIDENELTEDNILLICVSYDDVGQAVLEGWYDYYLLKQGYEAAHFIMSRENELHHILEEEAAGHEGDAYYKKIYVVGDTDYITYEGNDYEIIFQDFIYKLTVLVRRDG